MREANAIFETGAATDVGRVRKLNEDAYVLRPERGLWAVADGMGGHADGRLASAIIVDALARVPPPRAMQDFVQDVAGLIGDANRRIYEISQAQGATIGATVVILLLLGGEIGCLWAGDSRIYQVRSGRIRQVTRDHTEAQELIEQGVLTPEQAKTWPRRNVITRAIGVSDDPELELARGALGPQDSFVLCSDGLTGHVGDDEILAATLAHAPQSAAQALVELTLQRGATDNVTVVIVRNGRRGVTMGFHSAATTLAPVCRDTVPAIAGSEGNEVGKAPRAGEADKTVKDDWR